MAQDYYTILTNAGLAYEAQQKAQNKPITLTHYCVCDGNGAVYNPDPAMTALRREVTPRLPLNALLQDPSNPTWLVAEGLLPDDVGGWTIRALGIYTDTGILYAVSKCSESVKPLLAKGSGKQFYVRVIFQTSNAASVTLLVDNSVVMAPRSFVIDHVRDELAKRDHKQSVRVATVEPITLSGEQSIDGLAVVAGDRVLVKDQAAAATNGIYVVAIGVWTRATDADSGAKLNPGATVPVEGGTINADTQWMLKTDGLVTVGVTGLVFQWVGGQNAPTQPEGDSSKRVANTEFVANALGKIHGGYMFEIQPWVGDLQSVPKGFFPLSGVPVTELEVPGIMKAIADTGQPSCTIAERDDPLNAGKWGIGVGYVLTPDWTGAAENSIGGLYFAGDLGGTRRGQVMRGAVGKHRHATGFQTSIADGNYPDGAKPLTIPNGTGDVSFNATTISSRRYVTTMDGGETGLGGETLPNSVFGTWMIRLYGAITNVGSLDGAALVASVNALKSRVEVLEAHAAAVDAFMAKVPGVDQKWIDKTSSRAFGAIYTNGPVEIEISVMGQSTVAGAVFQFLLYVDEELASAVNSYAVAANTGNSLNYTIPAFARYRVQNNTNTALARWKEKVKP